MKICRSDILYAHDAPPVGAVAAMPEKQRGTPYLAQSDAVSPSRKVTATAPTRPRSAHSPVLDRDISTLVSAGLFFTAGSIRNRGAACRVNAFDGDGDGNLGRPFSAEY